MKEWEYTGNNKEWQHSFMCYSRNWSKVVSLFLALEIQILHLAETLHYQMQNHRIIESNLWTFKKGHLKPVVQGSVQITFKYLKGWRFHHHFLVQPVPVFSQSYAQEEPPVFIWLSNELNKPQTIQPQLPPPKKIGLMSSVTFSN